MFKSVNSSRCIGSLRRKSCITKQNKCLSTLHKRWVSGYAPSRANMNTQSDSRKQSNQRKFFDELGKKIGIQNPDDWYQHLSAKLISENNGLKIVRLFRNSSTKALMATYPEHEWIPWKFNTRPKGYWNSLSNQRKFFDWLGKELGIQQLDDWYQQLSHDIIKKNGAGGLLDKYKESPSSALMAAYPEHNWIPWKFANLPHGFWNNETNQRKFFDSLGKEFGIQTLDDWYEKLSVSLIEKHGGIGILSRHKNSPTAALMASYPEHDWVPWKFNITPQGFWNDKANQRKFFDELGKQLGVQTLDDWYTKLNAMVINRHSRLLKQYRNSPLEALKAAYPEHNWIPWKFNNVSRGFWNSKDNAGAFLAELSEKLAIQTLDDWYLVDWVQLHRFGASSLLKKYKGLYGLLKEHYPAHPWDPRRFKQTGKKAQRWLAVTLKKMFPNEEILEDYMHPKALLPSKRPMQLDVFIPSRSLAFEYQGIQHFEDVGVFSPASMYQQRDTHKRNLCAANNIKLIEVPYWWNRTQESLQEMVNKAEQGKQPGKADSL